MRASRHPQLRHRDGPGLTAPELMEALKGKAPGAASLVQRYVH